MLIVSIFSLEEDGFWYQSFWECYSFHSFYFAITIHLDAKGFGQSCSIGITPFGKGQHFSAFLEVILHPCPWCIVLGKNQWIQKRNINFSNWFWFQNCWQRICLSGRNVWRCLHCDRWICWPRGVSSDVNFGFRSSICI